MSENPRYTPLPVAQPPVFDDSGLHVGYKVSVRLQKAGYTHTESVDVIVGAEEAARLSAASLSEFTAWNKAQVEKYDLVVKANKALDEVS